MFYPIVKLQLVYYLLSVTGPSRSPSNAAYGQRPVILIKEWLVYLQHLKREYPYLFSLAVRTNPFDPGASVEVR